MNRFIMTVMVAALLTGCAAQPPQSFPHRVAEAGGLQPIQDPLSHEVRAYAGPSRIIAWMPLDMARGREHAHREINRLLAAAVQQALPAHTVRQRPDRPEANVVIEGPGCDPACTFGGEDMQSPMVRTAPDWLGGYKAYAWLATRWRDVGWWRESYPAQAGLDAEQSLRFYRDVSARLPEWMFLYLAPGEHGTAQARVLHQGRVFGFTTRAAGR